MFPPANRRERGAGIQICIPRGAVYDVRGGIDGFPGGNEVDCRERLMGRTTVGGVGHCRLKQAG
jgi:hypothetical protein